MREEVGVTWPQKESVPAQVESFKIDQAKLDEIIARAKNNIDLITKRVFAGELTILDSTTEMGKLTQSTLEAVAAEFASSLNCAVEELPFALFVFGATARGQMLPNSDLDASLAFQKNCPEEIRSLLKKILTDLPFNDETDIVEWSSLDDMKKENCPSLMEYNKVVEAKFITGNTEIAGQRDQLVHEQDTKSDKEKRFITQYGILHRSGYQSRSSEHGPNLKYDFGASRDIIFLDWYYLLNAGEASRPAPFKRPSSLACLDLITENKLINEAEREEIESSLELILLTRFALWSKEAKTKNDKLLYLSDYSLSEAYKDLNGLVAKDNITNDEEFIHAYHKAKSRLNIVVKKLFLDVAKNNQALVDIWKLAKEKKDLDAEVLDILKSPSWNELTPFAIDSPSPEILRYIVKRFAHEAGYEYILRFVYYNKNTTDDIKLALLDSRLDVRIKRKIEKALETTIKEN